MVRTFCKFWQFSQPFSVFLFLFLFIKFWKFSKSISFKMKANFEKFFLLFAAIFLLFLSIELVVAKQPKCPCESTHQQRCWWNFDDTDYGDTDDDDDRRVRSNDKREEEHQKKMQKTFENIGKNLTSVSEGKKKRNPIDCANCEAIVAVIQSTIEPCCETTVGCPSPQYQCECDALFQMCKNTFFFRPDLYSDCLIVAMSLTEDDWEDIENEGPQTVCVDMGFCSW